MDVDSETDFPAGRRELKLGESFKTNGSTYHGIKYDFKPTSADGLSETSVIEVSSTSVTLKRDGGEHVGGGEFSYSGSVREFPKEYLLVIDEATGEVTLEKLSTNIQLKRTKKAPGKLEKNPSSNSPLSEDSFENKHTAKKKNKQRLKYNASTILDPNIVNKKYGLIPQHSPLHPSPSRGSPDAKVDVSTTNNNKFSDSSSSSSPEMNSMRPPRFIPTDDDESSMTGFDTQKYSINLPELTKIPPPVLSESTSLPQFDDEFGFSATGDNDSALSDSSSGSDSDSDSSSSSAKSIEATPVKNGYVNGTTMKDKLLYDDLKLSSGSSDSD